MLRAPPAVLVTADIQAAVAATRLTTTTPIVRTQSSDPVQAGLIESFARPGGNVTGVANLGRELAEKRLALLKEAVPRLSRVSRPRPRDHPAVR